jgi:citrate synthase
MGAKRDKAIKEFTEKYSKVCIGNNAIDPGLFDEYGVKRGLRDKNGK